MKIAFIWITLSIIVIALLSFVGCGGGRNYDTPPFANISAVHRINAAIDLINVRTYDEEGDKISNFAWGDLTMNCRYYSVTLDVNLRTILDQAGVQRDDFRTAHSNHFDFMHRLNEVLNLTLRTTRNLTIRISDADHLMNDDNFDGVSHAVDLSQLRFNMDYFIRFDSNSIHVIADYGSFEIYSGFILDGVVRTENNGRRVIDANDKLTLVFAYDRDTSIVRLHLWDFACFDRHQRYPDRTDYTPLDIENAGKSVHIVLPLLELEKYNDGPVHAVRFIDPSTQMPSGILPRSFVIDDELHLYFNRLGAFHLTTTDHGATGVRDEFLYDRGMVFTRDDGQYITRGEFFYNLMMIHWAEGLHLVERWRENPPQDLVNVPLRYRGQAERALIGHSLMVDIEGGAYLNYILDGHRDGNFRLHENLTRRHLYMLLAGAIAYFDFDVSGLMNRSDGVTIDPSYSRYWQYRFDFLYNMNFVPYAFDDDGIARVAPYEYVTVCEAKNILLMLILGGQFERWQEIHGN